MSNELIISYPTGSTLYALLFSATGTIWNGSAFEALVAGNWTTYDIAMTEVATTGIYRGTMPAAVAGVYSFVVRKQAGGSPAVSDPVVGAGSIAWDGTAEMIPAAAGDEMDLVPAPNAAALAAAATASAAAILVTPANKLATDASGRVDVGLWKGEVPEALWYGLMQSYVALLAGDVASDLQNVGSISVQTVSGNVMNIGYSNQYLIGDHLMGMLVQVNYTEATP